MILLLELSYRIDPDNNSRYDNEDCTNIPTNMQGLSSGNVYLTEGTQRLSTYGECASIRLSKLINERHEEEQAKNYGMDWLDILNNFAE